MGALAFNHSKVQELRRLISRRADRYEAGRFVVEGPVFVAEEADGVVQPGVDGAGPVFELASGVLDRVASTETPQNPIAIVRMRDHGVAAEVLGAASFVIVLDRIGDPGNLGTILRSAEAAGADVVVLTAGSVDPYNPKVVRASAGALFHVPVVEATLEDVVSAGLVLVGTSSHEAPGRTVQAHTSADLTGRVAIVLGNEAAGLPDEWTDTDGPIHRWLTIPHRGRSESLNVAMAATVLVFEVARQRSSSAGPVESSSSTTNDAG